MTGTKDESIPLDPDGLAELTREIDKRLTMDGEVYLLLPMDLHLLEVALAAHGVKSVFYRGEAWPGTVIEGDSCLFSTIMEHHRTKAKKARGKPPPEYLKHDPSKRWKRPS